MEAPVLAVPSPRTVTVGEIEVAAFFNSSVRDAVSYLINPPVCNAVQATTQTIGSGLWTPLTLDTTIVDTYGGHSNTTNNSYYTAQVAGWCLVSAAVAWAGNTTGYRGIRILHNGTTSVAGGASEIANNGNNVTALASPAVIMYLNVGDYVQAEGQQTSGAGLLTSVNTDACSALTVVWLHT
jgi:hypothetical protein